MPVDEIAIERIRLDGDTQVREQISTEQVGKYADLYRDGYPLPPIVCFFDGVEYWLGDGFHRVHAAMAAGMDRIPCEVKTGTVQDAIWHACQANGKHGLEMKPGDLKKAIKMALKIHPDKSDYEIAKHCGATQQYVNKIRKENPSNNQLLDTPTTRTVTRGGKTYSMNVGGIGRRTEPEPEPESNPDDEQPSRFELPVSNPEPAGKLKGYVTLEQWNAADAGQRAGWLNPDSGDSKFNSQGDNENIEWALWSWNPVTGCKHDCPYCYARDIANRFYEQKFEPSFWPERLLAPQNTPFPEEKALRWIGHKNVFTCSMADLFGRWVPSEWIDSVLRVVREAPQWNFLFLTKFPQRMAEFEFPMNAWVGTTVDCQARVANAEKAFKKIKAGVKWLSCEPLIEPLKFKSLGMFDWLVVGGASSSAQTPEWHPPRQWVEDLERMARDAGCKVYEKSNLLERIRQYPGDNAEEPLTKAPAALRYLPEVVG